MKWNKNAAISVGIYYYIYPCNDFWYGWGRVVQPQKLDFVKKIFHMTMYFVVLLLYIIYQSFPCQNVTNKSSNINKSNSCTSVTYTVINRLFFLSAWDVRFYVVGEILYMWLLLLILMLSFTHLYILIINICKAFITFFYYIDKIWFLLMTKEFLLLQRKPRWNFLKVKCNIVSIYKICIFYLKQ